MNSAQYYLAKYIPDLMRQEPRNIGIIVWSPAGITSRFLGEKNDLHIDEKSIPPFVTGPGAYKQWVAYWRRKLALETIVDTRFNRTAHRSSPEFINILKLSNKGNFVLMDGGILTETVAQEELSSVTNDLFLSLVEDSSLQTRFMPGEISVPADFDSMGSKEIEEMFEGRG